MNRILTYFSHYFPLFFFIARSPEPNGEIDELNAQINEWKNKYEELLATSKSGSA
jgi:hypothetical protein